MNQQNSNTNNYNQQALHDACDFTEKYVSDTTCKELNINTKHLKYFCINATGRVNAEANSALIHINGLIGEVQVLRSLQHPPVHSYTITGSTATIDDLKLQMSVDKILHKIPLDLGDKCPIFKNLTSLCWIHQNQTVCLRKTILNIYNSKKSEIITMIG
jgi:hypothetical protein